MEQEEQGFGLVEIIVAMMLFGIIMVSAAPVLVSSISASAKSLAIANATQFANEQIGRARGSQGSCDSFQSFINQPPPHAYDGRGGEFALTIVPSHWTDDDVTACAVPGAEKSYPYTVKVARTSDPTTVLVETTTMLAVPGVG